MMDAKEGRQDLDAATAENPLIYTHPITGQLWRFHRQDQLDMIAIALKADLLDVAREELDKCAKFVP